MKYATRINSFLRFDSNLLNAFQSIGAIEGVDYVDLNYPEHFADYDIEVIKAKMEECGLKCNAINLRYGGHECVPHMFTADIQYGKI